MLSPVIKTFLGPNLALTSVSAQDTRITTREYGELVDFESGCWAAVLGHCRPEITQAISESAGSLFHTHHFFTSEHPGKLVEELTEAAALPAQYSGTFTTSGSEAVSLAIALSQALTCRSRNLSFTISYHGALPTLRVPRDPQQWLDLNIAQCLECPAEKDCTDCGIVSIDYSQIAAFVFEPGNSGGQVICPPEKLVYHLARQVKNAGGHLIVNEVTTGFGRTGKWFGFQHYPDLSAPDFIAMGKGLGNGYPISGVLARSPLAPLITQSGYRYVQSHSDDPLGCIVARKVVAVMAANNLVEKGNTAGEYLRAKLAEVSRKTGGIKAVRGRGLMNAAVLSEPYKAADVFAQMLKKGFFLGYFEGTNLLRFYPPLTIQKTEIDALGEALEGVLKA